MICYCIVVSARHCFSLEDFVVHIALPSLVKACNEGEFFLFLTMINYAFRFQGSKTDNN